MKYPIKYEREDFLFLETNENAKGTRRKKTAIDIKSKEIATFKYEQPNYICSEACSEKCAMK